MQRDSKPRLALVMGAVLLTAVAVLLGGAKSAAEAAGHEDAVLDWNLYAAQALINGAAATPPGVGQPPPVSVLHLAMVQGAVYDAVNMIDGGHEPYLDGLPPAPASASKAAAVATAAHDVLVGMAITPALYSGDRDGLAGHLADSLAAATAADGAAAVTAGSAAGAAAADAMLAERATTAATRRVLPSRSASGVGDWQPTPPGNVNDPNAWVRRRRSVRDDERVAVPDEGPGQDRQRRYGRSTTRSRTWAGTARPRRRCGPPSRPRPRSSSLRTPSRCSTARSAGSRMSKGLTLVEQARLFAMLNLSGADAAIGCWDDKEFWHFWRPITAIRPGETDGDPKTVGDPAWTSLINAPPYPDHPSGYNCQTGAFMNAATAFFGTKQQEFGLTATYVPPGSPPGTPAITVTRPYERFTDVVDDTIDARVWQGIHFRSPDEDGAWLGKKVARWLDKHYLEPVGADDDDDGDERTTTTS